MVQEHDIRVYCPVMDTLGAMGKAAAPYLALFKARFEAQKLRALGVQLKFNMEKGERKIKRKEKNIENKLENKTLMKEYERRNIRRRIEKGRTL